MSRYSGSEDIYRELVDDSKESWLYGLVAFAVVEEQKVEWMKHYSENNGRLPTTDEIRMWYEQQPQSVLLSAKGTAEDALKAYSAEVIELVVEEQRKEIEESIIVGEIRALNRFWPQFGVNLAGGFASALLFATLLIIVAFFVLNDTSPVEIGKHLKGSMEIIDNGKKN